MALVTGTWWLAGQTGRPGIFTGSELLSQESVKILGQSAVMSHQPDRPSGTRASRGPSSRDAGLLRIRTLTKGAAVTTALGAVAIGVVLAQPAQSQATSSPAATTPGQSAGGSASASGGRGTPGSASGGGFGWLLSQPSRVARAAVWHDDEVGMVSDWS